MKKLNLLSLIFAGVFIFSSMTIVKAQDEMPPPDAPNQKIPAQRPNLLRQLGLTKEQVKQIRQINQNNRVQTRAAQNRLMEANRTLDRTIYADSASDIEIQTRIKDVQNAHAEVIKFKSLWEFEVRKVLTSEQLVKFRELRQRFSERNKPFPDKRRNNAPSNADERLPRPGRQI